MKTKTGINTIKPQNHLNRLKPVKMKMGYVLYLLIIKGIYNIFCSFLSWINFLKHKAKIISGGRCHLTIVWIGCWYLKLGDLHIERGMCILCGNGKTLHTGFWPVSATGGVCVVGCKLCLGLPPLPYTLYHLRLDSFMYRSGPYRASCNPWFEVSETFDLLI